MVQKKLPLINSAHGSDTRNIINELIKLFNDMGYTYNEALQKAHDILDEAQQTNDMNESVQQQINTLIAESGTSDAEVLQARIDAEGNEYPVLKDRLDESDTQLAENLSYSTSNNNYLNDAGKSKGAIVSFIADDAPKSDLTKLLPIVQEKEIPVGIGVITNRVGKVVPALNGVPVDYMTWDEIKYMESFGCEIMGHSHNHDTMTSLSEDEIEQDIKTNKGILSSKGYIADGFIYPYNAHNQKTIDIVRKYYKYSFVSGGRYGNFNEITNDAIHRVNLGAVGDTPVEGFPSDTLSLEYYKAMVDWSIENNNWLVFVLHTALDNMLDETQQQYLKETIDYINSKNVEIVSPREGFNRYGNIIQSDKITMGADGAANTLIVAKPNSFKANNPITDFTDGAITVNQVSKSIVTTPDFPINGAGGYLETFRVGNQDLEVNKQNFTSVNRHPGEQEIHEYTRYWGNGTWTDWIPRNFFVNLPKAKASSISTQPLNYFKKGVSVISIGAGVSRDGLPLDTGGGVLTTYRLADSDSVPHSYQKYESLKIYGGTGFERKAHVRYWYNDAWSEWMMESETSNA